jgi:hypothetical protein
MKHIRNIYYTSIVGLFLLASQTNSQTVTAEISYGELIDKITILTIKSERIISRSKLNNIYTELAALQKVYDEYIGDRLDILQLKELLKSINAAQWDMEDAFRVKERNNEFDEEFIAIACNIRTSNDKRCSVKKQIDELCGSTITEEKSYEELV